METNEARVREELRHIVEVVSEFVGLPSRWSGTVELVFNADFKGKKRFNCDILIDASLAERDARWSTLIHEALHSVSAGYNSTDFQRERGWEEGVVEKTQRLLRPAIFSQLGISVDEKVFQRNDAEHAYNVYIDVLEEVRKLLEQEEHIFYLELLRTPIKYRYASLLEVGFKLPGDKSRTALEELSKASVVLRKATYELL